MIIGEAVSADDERSIEGALAYFRKAWPQNFPYLRSLHDKLMARGYEAKLPESRGGSRNKYPYIRYVRADGSTVGSANTGSFIFWGKRMQDTLAGQPGARVTRDGVRIPFDSDESVAAVVAMAALTDAQDGD